MSAWVKQIASQVKKHEPRKRLGIATGLNQMASEGISPVELARPQSGTPSEWPNASKLSC